MYGLRIRGVSLGVPNSELVTVEFTINEDDAKVLRASIAEFQDQLTNILKARISHVEATPWSQPPWSEEEVQRLVGVEVLLLSAMIGLLPQELIYDPQQASIAYSLVEDPSVRRECTVNDYRHIVLTRLFAIAGAKAPLPRLSRPRLMRAQHAADEKEWAECVRILEPWFWMWSTAVRVRRMGIEREVFENDACEPEGINLLASGYEGIDLPAKAETALRLGVQMTRASQVVATLFAHLGKFCRRQRREGEAIAYLRRALNLGVPESEVLLDLAWCLASASRYVAAAACLSRYKQNGGEHAAWLECHQSLEEQLGTHLTQIETWAEAAPSNRDMT